MQKIVSSIATMLFSLNVKAQIPNATLRTLNLLLTVFLMSTLTLQAQNKKVLFIMSAAKELQLNNGKSYHETGVFLSEFYLAYNDIVKLGYDVDFATPNGVVSSIDKESYHKKYWGKKDTLIGVASQFIKQNKKFKKPLTLEQALNSINSYSGMVVPGGQGLMVDLFYDQNIPIILKDFLQKGKPVGLICHAPALILSIPKEENPFIGYHVNSVTGLEELFIENFVMKGQPKNRKIAKQLKQLGLHYKKGKPAGNFAVRDRGLITSQNPYSNEAFSQLYIKALQEFELKETVKNSMK